MKLEDFREGLHPRNHGLHFPAISLFTNAPKLAKVGRNAIRAEAEKLGLLVSECCFSSKVTLDRSGMYGRR